MVVVVEGGRMGDLLWCAAVCAKNRGAAVAGIRHRRIYHGGEETERTGAPQTVLNDGGETRLLLLLLLDCDRAAAEEERKNGEEARPQIGNRYFSPHSFSPSINNRDVAALLLPRNTICGKEGGSIAPRPP